MLPSKLAEQRRIAADGNAGPVSRFKRCDDCVADIAHRLFPPIETGDPATPLSELKLSSRVMGADLPICKAQGPKRSCGERPGPRIRSPGSLFECCRNGNLVDDPGEILDEGQGPIVWRGQHRPVRGDDRFSALPDH